jgi:WW domain-containing oxidoreductase
MLLNLLTSVISLNYIALLRDAQKGATTTLNCAVNPKLNSQRCLYFVNCQPTLPSAIARNVIHQEQLWEISISIIKDWLSFSVLHKYGAPMGVEEIVPLPSVNLFSTSSRNNTEEETSAHQVLFQDTIQGTPLVTFNAAKYEDSNYSNSDEHTEDKPL